MIKKLKIKNFKSIKNLNIAFKNLNLLCGENASGKTSVIHAILSVIQKKHNNRNLDGEIIRIGNYDELKNYNSNSEISMRLIAGNGLAKRITLKPNQNLQDVQKDLLISDPDDDRLEGFVFEKDIFYINSNRAGAMDIYSKGSHIFGSEGKEVVSFLAEHQDDAMKQVYMGKFKRAFPNSDIANNSKLVEHVRFWMEKITNETIVISPIQFSNQILLTFSGAKNIRPINTGSGYSYILPILIMCLGSQLISDNPCVIIENPEIYLHPLAQFEMVKFFKFISFRTQLIIETHSEHILKATMDGGNTKSQVLLFKLEGNETSKTTLTNHNFLTHPVAYSEVYYKIFGIPTVELHILLFGMLHEKCNLDKGVKESKIIEFDKWLANKYNDVPLKKRQNKSATYQTLPCYIRNTINHPEQINISSGRKYNYSESELKLSIDFLLSKL